MSSPIGSPLGSRIDFDNIFKPINDYDSLKSRLDKDAVRETSGDSAEIGGRKTNAWESAKANLRSIRENLAKAVHPKSCALEGIIGAIKTGHPLSICTNLFEGIALDALHLAKLPVAVVKDTVDAAMWSAVAGVKHIAGTDKAAPAKPVGDPPDFDTVNLRTPETGRSGYFQYALKDGRIWTRYDPIIADKPFEFEVGEPISKEQAKKMIADARGPYDYTFNPENNSFTCSPKPNAADLGYVMRSGRLVEVPKEQASAWHLHDGNGGPKLPEGVEITKIQVAGDFIEAVASDGRVYSYDPTKPDGFWKAEKGCPTHGKVFLPKDARDWTLGEAVTAKPSRNCFKSMNPYTDIVGHWQDSRGREQDFNFVATSAVLSADGREIRYRDTGLAADFSRGFLTPHNGEFEADKLAGAGSTWFVCGTDPDGKPAMYTRMFDYEINGACPGQHYTYQDDKPFEPGKKYPFSTNEPFMPLPSWQKQEFPKLSGRACVTNHIDIVTTGQGNEARELRIEGRNAEGVGGYYSKGLNDSEWQFHPTQDKLSGEPIEVGKVLTGSLVIPQELKESGDPEISEFIEKYLLHFDREENQLMLIADSGSVKLTSRWFNSNSPRGLDWTANPHYDVTFKRDDTGQTYYEKRAAAPGLTPSPDMSRKEAQQMLQNNLKLKDELTKELKDRKRDHTMLWARAQVTEAAMRGLSFGLAILNLTEKIGHAGPVAELMPPLMDAHERSHCRTAFQTPEGYTRAMETLERNISQCRELLAS